MVNPWLIIAGMVGSAAAIGGAFLWGINIGKNNERLKWETAQVEVLVQSNTNLSLHLTAKDAQIAALQADDIAVGQSITETETRIIERIREVPVERIVKVGADCRLDYNIVGVRNGWAAGDSITPSQPAAAGSRLPDIGP